ncbi:MAG: hypothetical protein WA655_06620 [Candidatus Korobacteraceae bacterium]
MRKITAPTSVILLLLTVVALAGAAEAQDGIYWWPQLNTFVGLSDNSQLELVSEGIVDPNVSNQQIVLGPSLNFFFSPFHEKRIKTLDRSRNYIIAFRFGYRYVATFGDRSSHTHRGLIEVTPRIPLPARLVLGDRNQLVLIGQSTQVSWLYRNRVTLARSVETHSLTFTPYIQAQVIYNSDPGAWNRYNCGFGSTFKVNEHLQLDPYYQHHGLIDMAGRPTNGIGLKVELYFHNLAEP